MNSEFWRPKVGESWERPHDHDRIREAAFESRKHIFSKEDKMNERGGREE